MMYKEFSCVRISGGIIEPGIHEVIVEHPLSVYVNGRPVMTAVASPEMLREFVIGYLFTERIISKPDDIESIQIDETIARVITRDIFTVPGPKKTIVSGCGGSGSFLDMERIPDIQSNLTLSPESIPEFVKSALYSELHQTTGGSHIVGLVSNSGLLIKTEDIGRHTALDKAIGYAFINGVNFSECFVVTSGRISSEMIRKCTSANIPLIISRNATTTLALDIAEKKGVTVIGFVRGNKMVIYSHPERVNGVVGNSGTGTCKN